MMEIKKVAIDLEGVLMDLIRGFAELSFIPANLDDKSGLWKIEALRNLSDDFWANVPAIPEGIELFRDLENANKNRKSENKLNIFVVTTTVEKDNLVGKKKWIEKNLGLDPTKLTAVYRPNDKAFLADSETLLIDDSKEEGYNFRKAGGKFIHFNRDLKVIESACQKMGVLL